MKPGAPLRFLALVLLGWVGLRALALMPDWWREPDGDAFARAPARRLPASPVPQPTMSAAVATTGAAEASSSVPWRALRGARRMPRLASPPSPALLDGGLARAATMPERLAPTSPGPGPAASLTALAIPTDPGGPSRWSGSAWLLLRREAGGPALAPGGTLGGSQAGARILYRLNGNPARPLAIGARVYAPLRRTAAAEIAGGLDWQPIANVPVHLLAERRQALAEEGRSAWSLTVYGARSARLGSLRVDGYAQAGVVGLRSRDLFVDGAARVSAPIGPIEAGGAVWGAAQPGARRFDAGPQLSLPLAVGGANLRLSAEWRFRLAGDAAPDSGPALTLGADF